MPYIKDGIGKIPRWVELTKTLQIIREDINCVELFRKLRPHFPRIGVQNVAKGCELSFKESKETQLRSKLVAVL